MTFQRGNGTLNVEVSRLQSWVETADPDLYGHGDDRGVIREHRDDQANKQATEKYNRRVLATVALLGTVAPIAIKVLELLHIIPK